MQITAAFSNSQLNTFREVQFSHYSSMLIVSLAESENISLIDILDGTFTNSKDEQLIAYYCTDEDRQATINYYEQTVKTLATMQHSKALQEIYNKHKLMLEHSQTTKIEVFSFFGTVQQLKDLLDNLK